jgi:zinc finger SWIM domain-containing protein 3
LLDNAFDCLGTQLEEKLNISSSDINEISCKDQENVEPNVKQRDDIECCSIEKKEVQSKNPRRQRTWIDKFRKVRRKLTKSATTTTKK